MTARAIRFFYDFVCPYAYLASRRIDAIARQIGASVTWEPVLLGGIFKSIGAPDAPRMSESRARYNLVDMHRQARREGVELRFPEGHPRRTVLALRAAIAVSEGDQAKLRSASHALYAAYWERGEAIDDPLVVRRALDGAGFDGAAAIASADGETPRAELRRRTDEAVSLGLFGVPSFLIDGELEWGNDRLDLLAPASEPPIAADAPRVDVDFHFDFSSPFAYLASTQLRGLAARAGARIHYKPLLLGGLFKAISTPNVPLFEMPAPKRAHQGLELQRWAKRWSVPFQFSPHFPVNTTRALRAVLAIDESARADVIDALFAATWANGEDVANVDTLARILERLGLDPRDVIAKTESAPIKLELRRRTEAAQAAGVFGVPTFALGGELFWGQDRIGEVEQALRRASRT